MTPEQYHVAFSRTLSSPLSIDLVHAGVGLGTETFELEQAIRKGDRTNALEELSDIHWYDDLLVAVILRTAIGRTGSAPLLSYTQGGMDLNLYDLRGAVAEVQDVSKRVFWYGLHLEDPSKNLVHRLVVANATIRSFIRTMCQSYAVELGTLRERNIAKLYMRSPGSFDGLEFVNRDLGAERNLFENL